MKRATTVGELGEQPLDDATGAPAASAAVPAPSLARNLLGWFDSWAVQIDPTVDQRAPDWSRVVPFAILHLSCLLVIWVGWSPVAVAVAVGFYLVRMFAITGFYHRYFSHRAFKTSRPVQFVFACIGGMAVQRGPLWWASHHRDHHRYSDEERDVHSPVQNSFYWSHVGWIVCRENYHTKIDNIRDFARFPELRFLDRFDVLVPLLTLAGMLGLGWALEVFAPSLGTNAMQMGVWGFSISTVVLYHGTFSINSLAHRIGKRVFPTADDSRNNFLLSLITLGEGWHNNHHHYQSSARQGFRWWEIDITYYGLCLLERIGLVSDLRPVPARVATERISDPDAPGARFDKSAVTRGRAAR
ncbi:Fatty acid desaturase [Planctomycetes bacterium Pla163]|uniref:Fatty acid desaturase n=1 Tax=Rohdeia mirabilis TaxID=2528008 RepID=A0A518CVP0_9BACT|nr:Fatty acid desaturase [Planctomycetes bacterium Pla163]